MLKGTITTKRFFAVYFCFHIILKVLCFSRVLTIIIFSFPKHIHVMHKREGQNQQIEIDF